MDFAIYYKKIFLFTTKEEVVSLQWLFGVKLSFILSAPVHHCLKKKKKKKVLPFSKAQGPCKLVLSISTFYSWPSGNLHGFLDRVCEQPALNLSPPKKISSCLEELSWPSLHRPHAQTPGAAVLWDSWLMLMLGKVQVSFFCSRAPALLPACRNVPRALLAYPWPRRSFILFWPISFLFALPTTQLLYLQTKANSHFRGGPWFLPWV